MNNPGQYLKMIREKRGLGVKAVYSKTGVGDSMCLPECLFPSDRCCGRNSMSSRNWLR